MLAKILIEVMNTIKENTPNSYNVSNDVTSGGDIGKIATKYNMTIPQLKGHLKRRLQTTGDLLLKDKIQKAINKIGTLKEEAPTSIEPSTPNNDISQKDELIPLPTSTDQILNKFPQLKEILVELLTNDYGIFVKDVYWVAPRPTTFKIVLVNDQYFFLTWFKMTFIAQIEGKKYYLLNIDEKERAIKSIADILKMGTSNTTTSDDSSMNSAEPGKPQDKKSKEEFPFNEPGDFGTTPSTTGEDEKEEEVK